MPEEHEDVEGKLLNSPEVYQQTKFMAWFEKAFPWLLVGGAALGLVLMIFLPVIFFQEKTAEQLLAQSNLRLALLYTTGGVIAALGLLETYRKNTNDRAKANADIKTALKNQEHQAEVLKEQIRQFDENAFKERKAERRERYTKAIEQLGDEKSSVRMGGVYTLVGLVDEWLEEESIRKYEDRLKEGQVIINNLCAYIRSPFTLATRYDELEDKDSPTSDGVYKDNQQEFYKDKAEFKAEADVRLGIIKEIHDRLQGLEESTPGKWSDFEYNFSGSIFFYPIDFTNSYYTKPVNLSELRCCKKVNFSRSIYKGNADFSGSTYHSDADFRSSTYQGGVYFGGSTYQGGVYFGGSIYLDRADFRNSTYLAWVGFSESTYLAWVDFSESTYWDWVDFSESTYWDWVYFGESTYWDWVYFGESTYQGEAAFCGSTYWDWADFGESTYWDWANFGDSTYWDWVDFSASIHRNIAIFSHSIYKGEAYFNASIFYQETYFSEDGYNRFSLFTDCAPQFYDETNHKYTLFGSLDNNFTVENGRGYPIYRNLEGLPLGCKFLTSEWREGLEDKFQEIEETNNKLLEAKYPKEKAKLSKKLRALNEELHEWRDAITTVIVDICIISDQIIPREF